MKTILGFFIGAVLMIFSFSAFADRVTISGSPVILEKQGTTYIAPATVKSDSDYYYFSVDGTKQVCYREVQPSLAKVDLGIFAVKLGPDTVNLHCYTESPDYFVVAP